MTEWPREIKLVFRKIDPKALSLFTRRFLEKEMAAHNIREVAVSELLWVLKGQPMVFIPSEKKIVVDPSYPVDEMRRRLEIGNGCADLDLTIDECWGFIFFHECAHVDLAKSEWQCNEYARKRLLQWREGR